MGAADPPGGGDPIRFDAVDVDFDGRFALHGIDWILAHGEHWLVVGPNGASKSALAAVLAAEPELLVLDEPFDGLDAEAREALVERLAGLAERVPTVLVPNRLDEVPGFVTHAAYVDGGRLAHWVARDADGRAEIGWLLHLRSSKIEIPPPDPVDRLPALDPEAPLVRLTNAAGAPRRADGVRGHRLDDPPRRAPAADGSERQRQDGAAVPGHRGSPAVLRQRHPRVRPPARLRRERPGDRALHRLRLHRAAGGAPTPGSASPTPGSRCSAWPSGPTSLSSGSPTATGSCC